MLEILDLEPVTKCQSVKKEPVKQEHGDPSIKVPSDLEYHRAAQAIMKYGMEELVDFPSWQAKFKQVMMNNFGAEGNHEQDTSGSWDAVDKSETSREFRAEDIGAEELRFLTEPEAREGSASASAARRTSPTAEVRRPQFSKR